MGWLKDALYYQVWVHLQNLRNNSTLLTMLTAPSAGPEALRKAWAEVQNAGAAEGIRKKKGSGQKTGLKDVLSERPDLFSLHTNDRGHLLIELTEAARTSMPDPSLEAASQAATAASSAARLSAQAAAMSSFSAPPPPASAMGFSAGEVARGALPVGEVPTGALPVGEVPPASAAAALLGAPAVLPGTMPLPVGEVPGFRPLPVGEVNPEAAAASAAASAAAEPSAAASAPGGPVPFLAVGPQSEAPGEQWAAFAVSGDEPKAKRQKVAGLSGETTTAMALLQPLQSKAVAQRGPNGQFQDLIWTPAVAAAKERDRRREAQMTWALYTAFDGLQVASATLSQLGSDYTVAQIKKDPLYKNYKLIDIVKRYEDLFEIFSDPANPGGWAVRLQPNAQAALPPRENYIMEGTSSSMASLHEGVDLPPRIDNPMSTRDKMQGLRIELMYALARRGRKAAVQELGQETKVQKMKQNLPAAKKLIDFLKIFPMNFMVTHEGMALATTMMIELVSTDVSDTSMIDQAMLRAHQAALGPGPGKGYSKGGKGKGREPRDRQPSQHSASAWHSAANAAALHAAQAQAQAQAMAIAATLQVQAQQIQAHQAQQMAAGMSQQLAAAAAQVHQQQLQNAGSSSRWG